MFKFIEISILKFCLIIPPFIFGVRPVNIESILLVNEYDCSIACWFLFNKLHLGIQKYKMYIEHFDAKTIKKFVIKMSSND